MSQKRILETEETNDDLYDSETEFFMNAIEDNYECKEKELTNLSELEKLEPDRASDDDDAVIGGTEEENGELSDDYDDASDVASENSEEDPESESSQYDSDDIDSEEEGSDADESKRLSATNTSHKQDTDDVLSEEEEDPISATEKELNYLLLLERLSKAKKKKSSSKKKKQKSKKKQLKVDKEEEEEDDEYADGDSSDEEDLISTIGNVPVNWYDECDHLGYDVAGEPIFKPKGGDSLDKLINRVSNPNYHRTVVNRQTGQAVELGDEDLSIVKRVSKNMVPDLMYNMFQEYPDLYSHEVEDMPISGRPEHKRSFLPSKSEREKVRRIASLIKQNIYKRKNWRRKSKKPNNTRIYDIWKPTEGTTRKKRNFVAAPKLRLPGPETSYNPPPEYLVQQKKLTDKNVTKVLDQIQKKDISIRKIPAYKHFFKELLQRLHDLYFGSRARYMKVQTTSSFMLPKLVSRHELRPFPTMEECVFKGHRSIIRTICVHPGGRILASGSDDQTVRIWEINTRRCVKSFEFDSAISCVAWNPNPKMFVLAVSAGPKIIIMNPESYLANVVTVKKTNHLFKEPVDQGDSNPSKQVSAAVTWRQPIRSEWQNGFRVVIDMFADVSKIRWHRTGDFFISVQPTGISRSIAVHQMSKWRSNLPFGSNKGRVQDVQLHPSKPWMFLATQTEILVYDMHKQINLKKIKAQTRWISSLSIHPSGEHFIIGTYDKQVSWFEFECTKRPHKLQFHQKAVRDVEFHKKYPLFASCSDDGKIIITHGMAYEGWEKDPLIIPVKSLYAHMKFDDLCALDIAWHPHHPTLFSAGADARIIMWH